MRHRHPVRAAGNRPCPQLDGIFTIVARHGVGLDIHLHEPGEMGPFNVPEISGSVPSCSVSKGTAIMPVTYTPVAHAAPVREP
jgi:hypothetical protein